LRVTEQLHTVSGWGDAANMNALGDLLRSRRDTLRDRGDTVAKIAQRAGLAESIVYDHLARRDPFKTTPRLATLKKLAKGFGVDEDIVIQTAREATGPMRGNPLQLLIRAQQVELDRPARVAVARAKKKGHHLSEGTVSEVLSGKRTNLEPDTVKALAFAFDLPAKDVAEAARQSQAKVEYRLPPHLEAKLDPKRWAKIVKIVAGVLDVSDDEEA
jgi:transcriptional regulator with XRE-family HTH domain